MSEKVTKKAVLDADSKVEECFDILIRRLTGNIMNLFEMITTNQKQLSAAKVQLQKHLSRLIASQTRSDIRAILAQIAALHDIEVKFNPLSAEQE